MGIAEKSLPFVFDRFWQEDGSSKRKFQGVGIGLALVKELTEMMGGTVTVESQLGKGTTFTVRLPYEKAESVPQPAAGERCRAAVHGAVTLGRMAGQFVPSRGIFPHRHPDAQNSDTTAFARRHTAAAGARGRR